MGIGSETVPTWETSLRNVSDDEDVEHLTLDSRPSDRPLAVRWSHSSSASRRLPKYSCQLVAKIIRLGGFGAGLGCVRQRRVHFGPGDFAAFA
jgi:hypothetical protein